MTSAPDPRCVYRGNGLFFGEERAEVFVHAINKKASAPLATVFAPMDPEDPARGAAAKPLSVQTVVAVADNAQVGARVVKGVKIDVIDFLRPIRETKDGAMKIDFAPVSRAIGVLRDAFRPIVHVPSELSKMRVGVIDPRDQSAFPERYAKHA